MTTQPEALRLADALVAATGQTDAEDDVIHVARWFVEDAAAELRRLRQHELANEVWQVKTQWVQDTAKPEELGMHRADVMRQRLVRAETQRDALLEALQALYDEQNGPPLIRHQAAWEAAMEKARAAIKAVEEGK